MGALKIFADLIKLIKIFRPNRKVCGERVAPISYFRSLAEQVQSFLLELKRIEGFQVKAGSGIHGMANNSSGLIIRVAE